MASRVSKSSKSKRGAAAGLFGGGSSGSGVSDSASLQSSRVDEGGGRFSVTFDSKVTRVTASTGEGKKRKNYGKSDLGEDASRLTIKAAAVKGGSRLLKMAESKMLENGPAMKLLAGETQGAARVGLTSKAVKGLGKGAGAAGGALALISGDAERAWSDVAGQDRNNKNWLQKAGALTAVVGDGLAMRGAKPGIILSALGDGAVVAGDVLGQAGALEAGKAGSKATAKGLIAGAASPVDEVVRAGQDLEKYWLGGGVKETMGKMMGALGKADRWLGRNVSTFFGKPSDRVRSDGKGGTIFVYDDENEVDSPGMFLKDSGLTKKVPGVLSKDAKKETKGFFGSQPLSDGQMDDFLNAKDRGRATASEIALRMQESRERAAAAADEAAGVSASQGRSVAAIGANYKASLAAVKAAFNRQAKAAKSKGGFKAPKGRKSRKSKAKTGGGYNTGD